MAAVVQVVTHEAAVGQADMFADSAAVRYNTTHSDAGWVS